MEVRENRTGLLDVVCEFQGNFKNIYFREIRLSSLRVRLSRRGRSLEI